MKRLNGLSKGMAIMCAAAGLLAAGAVNAALTTIIQEDFSTAWNGQQPSMVNLPGGIWSADAPSWPSASVSYLGEQAGRLGADGTAHVSLQTAGGYSKPTKIGIDARFALTARGTTDAFWGAFFGFSSTATAGNVRAERDLYGIAIDFDGRVKLIERTFAAAVATQNPSWNPSGEWHTISYWIDTDTGSIHDLMVDGYSYTFTSTAFTDTRTNYFAWYGSAQAAGQYAYADYVRVSEIPEPASLALLGLAGLVLLKRTRKP